ncbi:hypothetical protein N2603_23270 [Bradyrhizobium huanghuaihaiense]|uniref:hypothetical protein n=1 Tax=Bradyrhizobium huanghuaihaiense TaxID=990078 RepID=UPI0021AA5A86|nr:hypothetical protein [Bradyrhizobium sp. CB3035]UWU73030.1 hypothetical protein N2603_23270 [Bradyrhizobium sp. CB3035]
MSPDDREWLHAYIKARIERHRVKQDLTNDMLRRSREALARSEELLRGPVPVIWHPEPPEETAAVRVISVALALVHDRTPQIPPLEVGPDVGTA